MKRLADRTKTSLNVGRQSNIKNTNSKLLAYLHTFLAWRCVDCTNQLTIRSEMNSFDDLSPHAAQCASNHNRNQLWRD